MASSDLLVQALMGSQMNQDPALAAALPRLQMAQALMQEGTNTAPVGSKWAGIGRVAQALLGGYMQNQSMSGIQDIVNQRNADTTNQMQYLRGGAPGGVAAPSPATAPQASADVPTGGAGGSLPAEYLPYYQEASARTGIPVNVLIAQGKQESNFNPNATGGAGEIGLHQILPSTARSPGFGMAGVDPTTLRDPRANINFAADYLKARGGPRTDFSNPATVEAALKNYNGYDATTGRGDPNYVQNVMRYAGGVPVVSGGQGVAGRTGGTDVAGPAAPTAPGGQPTGQAGGAAPQQYTRQQALDMMQRSIDVMSNPRNQYNPALMKGAQAQMELAKTLLGLDTYQQQPGGFQKNMNTGKIEAPPAPLSNYVDTPTGERDTTRTHPANYMPTPRMTTDASGNVIAVGPGGQPSTIAPNPSGFTGQTPEANAMRTMAVIGPKMANGTATPQEIANYHVAVSAFQNPQNVSLAPGQTSTQIARPLPPGMPQPGAMPPQQQTAMPPSAAPVYGVPGPQPPIQGVTSTGPLSQSTAPPPQQQTSHGSVYPPTDILTSRNKIFTDAAESAFQSRDLITQAQMLKDTLHSLGSTGPMTPFLGNLSRFAEQIGIPPETIAKYKLPPGEGESVAQAQANSLVAEIVKKQFPGQRITNNDLTFAQSTKPTVTMPLPASDYLIDRVIVPSAKRDVDRYGAIVNIQNPQHPEYDPGMGSIHSKLYEFDKQHPLSEYTKQAAPQGGSSPQSGAAKPSPEEVQAELRKRGLLK